MTSKYSLRPLLLLILPGLLLACSFSSLASLTAEEPPDLPAASEGAFIHQGGDTQFPELFAEAQAFLAQGEIKQAEETYRRIISLEPGNPLGYVGVGSCRLMVNDRLAAEENYRQALDLEPSSTGALTGMGSIAYSQGNYAQAITWYQQAIALNDKLTDAHYGLGISYDAAGEVELALEHYAEFLRLAPTAHLAVSVRERVSELQRQ